MIADWRGAVRLLRQRTHQFLSDRWLIVLAALVALYDLYWSYLSVERYSSLNAYVYDLGVNMERLYALAHPEQFPIPVYLAMAAAQPVGLILAPLSLADSYPLLLVVQTIALGAGGILVYLIAAHQLGSPRVAFLLGVSYLAYFPLAGVNWFDFHFQAFFIPLFLLGVALFQRDRRTWGGIVLLLGGAATFPYEGMVLLFGLTLVAPVVWRGWGRGTPTERRTARFGLVLGIAAVAILLEQYLLLAFFEGAQFLPHLIRTGAASTTIGGAGLVLLLILAPLLFLPLLSPRWAFMLVPFLALEVQSGCSCFFYPELFHLQYSALFLPFVFLGTIEGVGRIQRWGKEHRAPEERASHRAASLPRIRRHGALAASLAVVTATLVFATVFQPYGPFNASTPEAFPVAAVTHGNLSEFEQLQTLLGLLPASASGVLVQNDMPEAYPRPLAGGEPILDASVVPWKNATVYDATHDRFPIASSPGYPSSVSIDSAVDNPWTGSFGEVSPSTNVSMFDFARSLYESGRYGILGEASGMMALQRGYVGPVQYYRPYQQSFPASELFAEGGVHPPSGSPISATNVTDHAVWFGPYTFLSPGRYSIQYTLRSTDLSPSNELALSVNAEDAAVHLGVPIGITGASFPRAGAWTVFTTTLYVNDTYTLVEFTGFASQWEGTIAVQSVRVSQLAPGSTLFSAGPP